MYQMKEQDKNPRKTTKWKILHGNIVNLDCWVFWDPLTFCAPRNLGLTHLPLVLALLLGQGPGVLPVPGSSLWPLVLSSEEEGESELGAQERRGLCHGHLAFLGSATATSRCEYGLSPGGPAGRAFSWVRPSPALSKSSPNLVGLEAQPLECLAAQTKDVVPLGCARGPGAWAAAAEDRRGGSRRLGPQQPAPAAGCVSWWPRNRVMQAVWL